MAPVEYRASNPWLQGLYEPKSKLLVWGCTRDYIIGNYMGVIEGDTRSSEAHIGSYREM